MYIKDVLDQVCFCFSWKSGLSMAMTSAHLALSEMGEALGTPCGSCAPGG